MENKKFYKFTYMEFGYYALIAADDMNEAMEIFESQVCDNEYGNYPIEVNKEYVVETLKEYEKSLDEFTPNSQCLLVLAWDEIKLDSTPQTKMLMKYFYFEFENYEYPALIAAFSVEDAINSYNDNIEDLTLCNYVGEPPQPKEITEVEAFGMVNSICSIEEVEEIINSVEALENDDDIDYETVIMLIDSDLKTETKLDNKSLFEYYKKQLETNDPNIDYEAITNFIDKYL